MQRLAEQARYWGLDTNQTMEVGRTAAEFTRRFLAGTFTVRSKREDARGQSSQPRFYALVQGREGDLGEALVERGLARVYGMRTAGPDGTPAEVIVGRLRGLEATARSQGRGAWGWAGDSRGEHVSPKERSSRRSAGKEP